MARKPSKVKMCRSSKISLTLFVALIAMMCVLLRQMNAQITDARSEQSIYAQRLAQLQEQNARLAEDIANRENIDLIGDIARNELGMAEPGEKIFRFRN